jgi:hypothetical protein
LSLSVGEVPLAVDDLDACGVEFKACVLSDDCIDSGVSAEAALDIGPTLDDATVGLLADASRGCCTGGGEAARVTCATASLGDSFFCCDMGCELNCCTFAGVRDVAAL